MVVCMYFPRLSVRVLQEYQSGELKYHATYNDKKDDAQSPEAEGTSF